jgi:hypothetical protein
MGNPSFVSESGLSFPRFWWHCCVCLVLITFGVQCVCTKRQIRKPRLVFRGYTQTGCNPNSDHTPIQVQHNESPVKNEATQPACTSSCCTLVQVRASRTSTIMLNLSGGQGRKGISVHVLERQAS